MLNLTWQAGESIVIGDKAKVTVLRITNDAARPSANEGE